MAKILNWENLRSMICPYDDEPLTEDIEVRCTVCFFHITKEKFNSIVAHRSYPDRKITKLKWQNIHYDRCPADGERLTPATRFEILKCTNPECTFSIRQDSIEKMIKDPKHMCNIFKNDHGTRR